jgi:hypothetical protein
MRREAAFGTKPGSEKRMVVPKHRAFRLHSMRWMQHPDCADISGGTWYAGLWQVASLCYACPPSPSFLLLA